MKKINCFKNILILFFTLTSFSCSNLFEQELGQSISESSNAFITLSVGSGDGSRTVLPGAEESELTTLVLKGTKEGEAESSLGSWVSVSEMRNAAIPLSTGSWTFTLTAKKGGTSFCGSTSKNINVGENSLSFEMKISDSSTGAGSFSITLNFGSAPNADKVTKALATLENLDGSSVTGVNAQALIPVEKAVTFSADGITAGTYRAKVIFYATEDENDIELASYRELLQISDSIASTASRTIESFDNLYTITYNCNGGVLAEGVTLRENVTRKSAAITLPELAKDYYTFDGWFTTENFAEGTEVTRLENFTGNVSVYAKFTPITYTITYVLNGGTNAEGAVTTYTVEDDVTLLAPEHEERIFVGWYTTENFSSGLIKMWNAGETHENLTVYAKWGKTKITAKNIVNEIASMTDYNYYWITVYGEITPDFINQQLKPALTKYHSNKHIYVELDLSKTTGLTELLDGSFYGCTSLAKIILPETLTSIGNSAFYGCTGLESIKLPDGLISIGKSAFVGCSTLKNINIPNGVKNIEEGTFYNCAALTNIDNMLTNIVYIGDSAFGECTGLKSVTIPANVKSIGRLAFQACSNITKITLEDKSDWKVALYCKTGVNADGGKYIELNSGSYTALTINTDAIATKYLLETYCTKNWGKATY